MRQKRAAKPRKSSDAAAERQPDEIASLVAQSDEAAAVRLQEIAGGEDKALAKAARRGLYTLKQAGIEPPPVSQPQRASPQGPVVASRAWVTNVDGAGTQMLVFQQDDPYGGSPYVITFLTSYFTGLKDLGGNKMPRREIEESFSELRKGDGKLLADTPVDYVRHLLRDAADRTRAAGESLPQGYAEWAARAGAPEEEYARPLIYTYVDAEALKDDLSVSRDPEKLFESPYFQSWFLHLREVAPWEEKFMESQQSALVLDDSQRKARGDKVIEEATEALLPAPGVRAYRRILEEQALALYLSDQEELAKQAVYHALTCTEETPAHAISFLRTLAARSIFVVIALRAQQEEEEEKRQTAGGLIARV
jgi:hypothetical protein